MTANTVLEINVYGPQDFRDRLGHKLAVFPVPANDTTATITNYTGAPFNLWFDTMGEFLPGTQRPPITLGTDGDAVFSFLDSGQRTRGSVIWMGISGVGDPDPLPSRKRDEFPCMVVEGD